MGADLKMSTKKSKMMYNMSILVIRGSGFIVEHLKEYLIREKRYQGKKL